MVSAGDFLGGFLVALVLNLPDRASIDTLLRARFPDEAPGAVLAGGSASSVRNGTGISGLRLSEGEREAVCRPWPAAGATSPLSSRQCGPRP